jgi:hypothetical protein
MVKGGLMTDFDTLVEELKKNGYRVEVNEQPDYTIASVTGKNIRAGFCTPGSRYAGYLDGKIAADHVDCFDKWSKCPLIVNLPQDEEKMKSLLGFLEKLGTDEGYNFSNTCWANPDSPFPREI